MKNDLRPAVGTILENYKNDAIHRVSVVTKLVENDDKLVVHFETTTTYLQAQGTPGTEFYTPAGQSYTSKQTRKHSKFLAVNGPREGEYLIESEAPGYVAYNCSQRTHTPRWRKAPSRKLPSVVLVYL